jgi:hypothetical protein
MVGRCKAYDLTMLHQLETPNRSSDPGRCGNPTLSAFGSGIDAGNMALSGAVFQDGLREVGSVAGWKRFALKTLRKLALKLHRYYGAPRRIARRGRKRASQFVAYLRQRRDRLQEGAASRRRLKRIGQFEKARSPVTLFVAPEAGLAPFFGGHALIARLLMEVGLGTMMLACDGLLPICSVKFAMGMGVTTEPDTENRACVHCTAQAERVSASHDLSRISIEKVLDAGLRVEIETVVSANVAALWELKYDGIDFGAMSLGETLRAVRKTSVAHFAPADHAVLKALVIGSLSIYFAVRALLSRFNIKHIVYYGDYAYHLPLLLFASRTGITVTHISHGYVGDIDQRYLSLRPGVAVAHALNLIDRWPSYRDRPLAPLEVEKLFQGAVFRLQSHGGISTYSPVWRFRGGDIRTELGLDPARKTIVAFPSSMDEIVCTRLFMQAMNIDFGNFNGAFASQDDWLGQLIEWTSKRQNFQLVVRLHPRMASGARFKTAASDAFRSKEMLADLPANVLIEWPESKISSYNLAEVADVAVTAWSSMALELSRLGIPVVSAFPDIGLTPVGGFVRGGQTSEAFFQEVDRAADRGSSLAEITESFRWTYIQHWSHLVDIADITPSHSDVPPYKRPLNARTILDVVTGGKDLVEINMSRHESAASAILLERRAIVRCVEKIVGLLGAGRIPGPEQGLLILSEAGESIYRTPRYDGAELTLALSADGFVKFNGEDVETRRYSRVVHRLARLLRESQDVGNRTPDHEEPSLQMFG